MAKHYDGYACRAQLLWGRRIGSQLRQMERFFSWRARLRRGATNPAGTQHKEPSVTYRTQAAPESRYRGFVGEP
jgi:hypothetical protein